MNTARTFTALSVVAPAGDRIRAGAKSLEVRRWAPETLPLRDLLIVQNRHRLGSAGAAEDPAGTALALVDVGAVRPWREDEVAAACASSWEPGWLARELTNVRPVEPVVPAPARRRLYSVTLPATDARRPRFILFDWGDTLMSEDGPPDRTMADWPEVRVIAGAREALAALAARHVLGVATNATISRPGDVRRALTRAGLAPFLTHIFCRAELGCPKADPRFWAQVLAQLGATAGDVLMIGDSLEQDVLGPQAAGIPALWFNWKTPGAATPPGVRAIGSLADLPSVLAPR